MKTATLLLTSLLLARLAAVADNTATIPEQVAQRLGRIEHLGRSINGSIFEADSPLSDMNGLRRDVLEKVRELNTPSLRWPLGMFTRIGGHELTAASLLASNSVAQPNQDCVQSRRVMPTGASDERALPPRSITLLQ